MAFRRDDNWYTDVMFRFKDPKGLPRRRRIRKKVGPRKQEAIEAEAQIRGQIAAGTYDPEPLEAIKPTLFKDFCEEEFLPWSRIQHSSAHHTELGRMLTARLIPFFEGLHLHEIVTKRVEDYKLARRGQRYRLEHWGRSKKTSAATVNRELSCLKIVFRQAVAWGRLEQSPAAGVSALREPPNPPRLLSRDEIARLLAEMPDHSRAAIGCAVYAGLRKNEILRLRWQDIDMKAGVLTVASREGRTTKNYQDRRIPIAAELAALLKQHPQRLGSEYVFAGRAKGHQVELKTALNTAATTAGIEKVTMHQLRHAFCSHALMSKVDPRTVMKWMGHRDLQTTLRYAHVESSHEQSEIHKISYRQKGEGRIRRGVRICAPICHQVRNSIETGTHASSA